MKPILTKAAGRNRLAARAALAGLILAVMLAGGQAVRTDTPKATRRPLRDPSPTLRLRAALERAEANDAEAIPILIDLLAELPRSERKPAEDFLGHLAGEWAPRGPVTEDEIGRRIHRDAWLAWWRATDGKALLALLQKHTPTEQTRSKVRELITQLEDRKFAVRQAAYDELFALGRIALPQLREKSKGAEGELTRRIRTLIARIEREPSHRLPRAAFRLLALRKPAGTAEMLLAYRPFVEEETQIGELQDALAGVALRDGKLEPALLRSLEASQADVRIVAAEALVKGGGAAGCRAVRQLLMQDVPTVRLSVALALARAGGAEGIPVLIDLLTVLPTDQVGQVEDALYQLAGESAPEVSLGEQPAERKKCRAAWAAWWKVNAQRVDLRRLTTRVTLGFTVLCDSTQNRVYEIDRRGKVRWSIDQVPGPVDAWVLPGERVLIAEANGQRVCERDFKGKVLWEKHVGRNSLSVQPLPGGNVVIATDTQVVEVDRAGKEVHAVSGVGNVWDAYRTRTGRFVCLLNTGECVILDAAGKKLKSFTAKDGGPSGSLDVLANDRLLIASSSANKVMEYDGEGKKLWEVNAPGVTTATGLPNGHVLVASQNERRVYELDRAGKIVWEQKDVGGPFRARRR